MEHEFTKQEIFSLYLNVIFFGQRAYGVAAAAETFFGKTLDELTVAEAATLAGVPQGAFALQPDRQPAARRGAPRLRAAAHARARLHRRRDRRSRATKEPMQARAHAPLYDVEAPYVAEMARLEVRQRFGAAAENAGYKVYTTIDGRLQAAANRALRIGLIEYDRRHGWRGAGRPRRARRQRQRRRSSRSWSTSTRAIGNLLPAVVVVGRRQDGAACTCKARGFAQIDWDGLSWARKALGNDALGPAPKTRRRGRRARRRRVCRRRRQAAHAQLAQVPEAQSALVALDPHDGAIAALVGGFDYFTNKYNRVTQAQRQPGSGFKPFLYSAALENGFTPASVMLDAPFVIEGQGIEETWRPENSTAAVSAARRGCAKRWCIRATWSRSACCARSGIAVRDRLRHALRLRQASHAATT